MYVNYNKKKISKKKRNSSKLNLKNNKSFKRFIKKNEIKIIINLISLTDIEKCENFKQKAKLVNSTYIKNIVDTISTDRDVYLIHISTDHLFDGKYKKKYSESSPTRPLNYYGNSKLLAEKFVNKYKKSLIIRTNFFGKSFTNKKSFSDNVIINLKNKNKIYLWDDVYISPMHVINLVKSIVILIDDQCTGIINISSEKISKYNLGIKIARYLNLDTKLINKNSFNKKKFIIRPKNMALDNRKIIKLYPKYKSMFTLKSQIKLLNKY